MPVLPVGQPVSAPTFGKFGKFGQFGGEGTKCDSAVFRNNPGQSRRASLNSSLTVQFTQLIIKFCGRTCALVGGSGVVF